MRYTLLSFVAGLLFVGGGCTTVTPRIEPGSQPVPLPEPKPVACTMEYAPVCGFVPVVCIAAPCYPTPHTFSNRCMATAGGAVKIIAGECAPDQKYPVD